MAAHSNTLSWRIPETEEPGGLQPMGSQRVGHDSSDYAEDPSKLLNTLNITVCQEPSW